MEHDVTVPDWWRDAVVYQLYIPSGRPVLLVSTPLADDGLLPADTAVWLG